VFSVNVPPGNRITATATPSSTMDPTLSLFTSLSACTVGSLSCAVSKDTGNTADPETLVWTNVSGSTVTVYLAVDGYSIATSAGTFALQVDVAPAPADDVCEGATPLTSGVTLSNQSMVSYVDDYSLSDTQCYGSVNPDRAYSFNVPMGQRTLVTVTPATGTDVRLNLVPGPASTCGSDPRVCTAGTNQGTTGAVELLSFYNTTTSNQPHFAIVDATAGGSFSIVATTSTPIANDTCNTSNVTLVNGTSRSDTLTNMVPDYGLNMDCGRFQGPDRVYRVSVNPAQTLTVTVTPGNASGGFDPVIALFSGDCESPANRVCEDFSSIASANQAETFTWVNGNATTSSVFLVVGDKSITSTDRSFTISASLTP